MQDLKHQFGFDTNGEVVLKLIHDYERFKIQTQSNDDFDGAVILSALNDEDVAIVENAIRMNGISLKALLLKGLLAESKRIVTSYNTAKEKGLLENPSLAGSAEIRIGCCVEVLKAWNLEKMSSKNAFDSTFAICITQSMIQKITGSAPRYIKEYLAAVKDEIDAQNADYQLTKYSNRGIKPEILTEIDRRYKEAVANHFQAS